jgi:hypothetical protein
MTDLHVVPARRGRAMRLAKGQAIQIINTPGQQVVDTWCFNADDLSEFMSMEHVHATLQGIFPATGDGLTTNRRRPILILEEDTSPGRHDTVIAACDVHRYAALGCTQYQDNCTDNLRAALGQLDMRAPDGGGRGRAGQGFLGRVGGGQDLLGPQDPPVPDLDRRGLSTVDRGAGVRDFKGLAVGVRGVLRVWLNRWIGTRPTAR